jgi:NAD(P)-dependent dehydrogenase (short-subunit alcohol dehydrogenase family)
MEKLAGKIAVITGGNSGIGLATAQRFVAEGAYVFVTGRRQAELDAALKLIGSHVTGVQGDVANLADLDRLYATVKQQKGRIDILFANAGGGEFAPLGAITEAHFDKTFNSNVKGLLFTVQKALPLLVDGGSIILTASTTSTVGTPAFSVYSATKAAVRSFARNWILDLKGRNIRVNTLSPGATETPGWDKLASTPAELDQMKSSTIATIPMGQMGTPDEIAKAAVFLASDDSSYVTGIELFVDGGMAQISPLRAVDAIMSITRTSGRTGVASPAGPPSGHEATAGPCVGPSRTAAPARLGAERSSGSPGYRAAAPRASAADRSCQSSSGGRCGVAHRGATGPYGSGTPPQQVAPSAEARSRSDGSTRAPPLHGSGGR